MKLLNGEQVVFRASNVSVTNRRVVQESRRALLLTDTRQLLLEAIDSADLRSVRQRAFLYLAGVGAVMTVLGIGAAASVAMIFGAALLVAGAALWAFWTSRNVAIRSGASIIYARVGNGAAQRLVDEIYQAKDALRRS